MPKYTQDDIRTTYQFYQNIRNQREDLKIYSKNFNYIKKQFNEAFDGVQETGKNEVVSDITKCRLVATYLYLKNIGEHDFYQKARMQARAEEGSFSGLEEDYKTKIINEKYEEVKESKEYKQYIEMLKDYKAKVMKATGVTNEQIDVLLHDVEANHSGFENIYEIAENGDKTYEKVEYKEETGIKGKVKKLVGKDTEHKETTYVNKSYNEPQAKVPGAIPIEINDVEISEKEVEEANLDERYETLNFFGEVEQRKYEDNKSKEEVIDSDKVKIEVDLEKEEKKEVVKEYVKTNNGFFILTDYIEKPQNVKPNVGINYLEVAEKSNQDLLADFNDTFGLNGESTPEELKANMDLSKVNKVTDIEQAKLNNDCVRKQKGSLLTVNNLNRGLAIYKVQKERYTSKNGFVRFFTYFSKENRELRNNYKKMEKVLIDAGVPKSRLDGVVKNTKNGDYLISDLAQNGRIVKEDALKDLYGDNFVANYNDKFVNKKANDLEIKEVDEITETNVKKGERIVNQKEAVIEDKVK